MFEPFKTHKVEISYKTIIFTVFFLISLWLIYQLRSLIVLLFICLIIATALHPLVNMFQKIKLPRFLAIILSFVVFIGIIAGIIAGIIPTLIEQSTILTNSLIKYSQDANLLPNIDNNIISSQIQTIFSSFVNILKFTASAFSNVITVFSLMVFSFYLLIEWPNLPKYARMLFDNGEKEKKYLDLIDAIEKRLGGWVRGEILLMLIVGTLSYIFFSLVRMPFALPLALLAGLLELVPNLGPTIATIPAIIVGFSVSVPLGVGALIISLAVQQLENNLIVPMVMKSSLGLNPIITLLCLMIGGKLGGVGGAILAIPLFITLQTVIKQLNKK